MEDGKWQDGKSLAECNRYMLDNCVSTDVMFIVGEDKKEVRAHKYVLGSRSSVFYAMLFGPMAESISTIKIPDIEPDIFFELLRFVYYEDLSITTVNVTSLMLAADKYNVTGVVNKCEEYMNSHLAVDSVCEILNCAVLLNREDLRKKCLIYISEHAYLVFQSSSFPHLHRDNLKMILQSGDTFITEELIYESVLRWGEHRCEAQGIEMSDENIRDYLGDLIKSIRFTEIDIEYFDRKISKRKLLTSNEKVDIFECLSVRLSKNINIKSTGEKNSHESICNRGVRTNKYWSHRGPPDRLDYTVSDTIRVLGFVMNTLGAPAEYDVEAQLKESCDVLATQKAVIKTLDGEKTFRVMFRCGVSVQPGVRYTASVKMVGPKSFGCAKCSKSVTTDGVKFDFFNAAAPNNCTDVSRGQIPGIVFTKRRR